MGHSPSLTITHIVFLRLGLILFLSSSVSAFNITYALGKYSEFSTFNKLLSKTNLAHHINSRMTITVMAVRNSPAMDFLASKPDRVMKQVLATHVLLDYMDADKLAELEKPQELTTMWQQSGKAIKNDGHILVARVRNKAYFRSAVKGAKQTIRYVKEVATQPFNISLIEVSQPLFAPGVDDSGSPIPSGAAAPVSPLPIQKAEEATSPDDDNADAPGPDSDDDALESSSAPAPAPTTTSLSPAADDEKVDDEPTPKMETDQGKSAGNKVVVGGSVTAAMIAAALMAF